MGSPIARPSDRLVGCRWSFSLSPAPTSNSVRPPTWWGSKTGSISSSLRRQLLADEGRGDAPLWPGQRHPGKLSANPSAVIIHVPLPRVRRATVDKGVMETVCLRVVEHEGHRVASHRSSANTLRVERAGRGVVEPETGVLAGAGVPTQKDDCLIGRRPVRCTLSGHLMHLDILAAQDPVEGHIMGRRLPGYRPAQHPVPDQTIEK